MFLMQLAVRVQSARRLYRMFLMQLAVRVQSARLDAAEAEADARGVGGELQSEVR